MRLLVLLLAGCSAAGSSTIIAGPEGGAPDNGLVDPGDSGTLPDASPTVDDYAALFGPPASTDVTPNSLNGLWAGAADSTQDVRVRFSNGAVVLAQRCSSSAVAGITVAARNSSSSIALLESKSSEFTGVKCMLSAKPIEVPRCMATTASAAESEAFDGAGCFFLSGTTLNFYNVAAVFSEMKLTKLSD